MKTFSTLAIAAAVSATLTGGTISVHAADKTEDEIRATLERQRAALQNPDNGTAICDNGRTDCERGVGYFPADEQNAAKPSDSILAPAASSQQANTGTTITQRPSQTAAAAPAYKPRPSAQNAALRVPELPRGNRLDLVILFEYDSAFIRPASRPQLSKLCNVIATGRSTDKFTIVGHTDASGSRSYNMGLSKARAAEVRRHLMTECDISGERLEAVGLGEERLDSAHQPRSEKQRRVEIQLNLS